MASPQRSTRMATQRFPVEAAHVIIFARALGDPVQT